MKRLDYDADDLASVTQYYHTRSLQMASLGYRWNRVLTEIEGGYLTTFDMPATGLKYDSFFITKSNRGKGAAVKALQLCEHPIVTIADCQIEQFLADHCTEPYHYKVEKYSIFDSAEYEAITKFYGDGRAKRSGQLFMNHIDEGLWVMAQFGASDAAKRAYCLHPIIQLDEDMKQNLNKLLQDENITPKALALAIEYRHTANNWLSDKLHGEFANGQPILSPIDDVNDMLVADKVQNYKDYILYHRGTHPRTQEYDKYFKMWLSQLGIPESRFTEWFSKLCEINPPGYHYTSKD